MKTSAQSSSCFLCEDEPREWRGSAPSFVILNEVKDLTIFLRCAVAVGLITGPGFFAPGVRFVCVHEHPEMVRDLSLMNTQRNPEISRDVSFLNMTRWRRCRASSVFISA